MTINQSGLFIATKHRVMLLGIHSFRGEIECIVFENNVEF